ncbi:aspartyl/asparaginyl beta-hydroxylase domain-containing protein [Hyphococcus flavus]|uniref:Aspartyl/asparaginyl beta-hydroxylase domain-containing protein n=1 Tax=Hyphococcus flavus TaxID=1866326 RepID=A0AAE9ZFG2_9PROT|nr:aspartyl/asparaginyl beta-hydroxylase domain-containing protein [Hyphococcus flavus]WDI32840.1 aspartyl/asparaginyl beta-hydroxylase domain-containing protein [Hyphococcus flavus]
MPDISQHTPDEFLEAFLEDPGNAPLALYAGAALDAAGRLEEALTVWTFGADQNAILRTIHLHPEANDDLRAHSKRADDAIRNHFSSLHRSTVEDFARTLDKDDLDRVRSGVWLHYAIAPVNFRVEKQRPLNFYVPGLPARPITPNDTLPWTADIEAAWEDIRAEFEAAIAQNAKQYPYVPEDLEEPYWASLRGKMDWSALYMHFNANVMDEAAMFPKTLAALETAPTVKRDGVPLETFFSRLQPGAHIPPHHGLTNTRLTVHLPLIVPDGCEIRVGDELHQWQEGKIVAFDDSFEHEAWNKSDKDRVVMIFETHHPDLSPTEIEAIEKVYSVFDEWVSGRADRIGLEFPPAEETTN